jgi:hypothetical protein
VAITNNRSKHCEKRNEENVKICRRLVASRFGGVLRRVRASITSRIALKVGSERGGVAISSSSLAQRISGIVKA